jgi:hypothetical protein
MDKNEAPGDDDGGDLAAWLKQAGKRVARRPANAGQAESAEELLDYLRSVTGRPIRTREDIREYFESLRREQIAAQQALARRRLWRESVLLFLLAGAYLQYYYWDVQLQIEKLPRVIALVS